MELKLKKVFRFLTKSIFTKDLLFSVIAFIMALIVAAVFMIISGFNPISSYVALWKGAFGDFNNIAMTIGIATPLILAGLSVCIAKSVGFFNIGVEGQLIAGALATALVGAYAKGLSPIVHILLCFLAASITGGLIGVISVKLKQFIRVSELIITVMLNYVILYFIDFLVVEFFVAPGNIVRTSNILPSARLTKLVPYSRLTTGVFVAIVATFFLWWLFDKTRFGYEIQAIGHNSKAAQTGGINIAKKTAIAMFISGSLAAFGGAVETMGVHGYYIANMTTGYGYDGLTIAIMGGGNPVGSLFAALVFGALRSGSSNMNRTTNIPGEFILVLQGLVILFVSAPRIINFLVEKFKPKKKEEI